MRKCQENDIISRHQRGGIWCIVLLFVLSMDIVGILEVVYHSSVFLNLTKTKSKGAFCEWIAILVCKVYAHDAKKKFSLETFRKCLSSCRHYMSLTMIYRFVNWVCCCVQFVCLCYQQGNALITFSQIKGCWNCQCNHDGKRLKLQTRTIWNIFMFQVSEKIDFHIRWIIWFFF